MTRMASPRRGRTPYEPRTRNIYLAELDELCELLIADGHEALARRVRVEVDAHVLQCSRRPGKFAPTVAKFEPRPTERPALTAALVEVRANWSCA